MRRSAGWLAIVLLYCYLTPGHPRTCSLQLLTTMHTPTHPAAPPPTQPPSHPVSSRGNHTHIQGAETEKKKKKKNQKKQKTPSPPTHLERHHGQRGAALEHQPRCFGVGLNVEFLHCSSGIGTGMRVESVGGRGAACRPASVGRPQPPPARHRHDDVPFWPRLPPWRITKCSLPHACSCGAHPALCCPRQGSRPLL